MCGPIDEVHERCIDEVHERCIDEVHEHRPMPRDEPSEGRDGRAILPLAVSRQPSGRLTGDGNPQPTQLQIRRSGALWLSQGSGSEASKRRVVKR